MTDSKKQPRKKAEKSSAEASMEPVGKLDIVAIELRRAREAKSLSHSELYRQTGISRSVLFGYEAGRTKPGAKELRLLSEALGVSPTRLLYGSDEPFKPSTGLRSLVKLRNSPTMAMVVSMMMLPVALAVLDDDQIEALLTILSSLVESRDKKAYQSLSAIAEVFAEEIGNGSPEEIAAFSKLASNHAFMASIQKRIDEKISSMK